MVMGPRLDECTCKCIVNNAHRTKILSASDLCTTSISIEVWVQKVISSEFFENLWIIFQISDKPFISIHKKLLCVWKAVFRFEG